MSNPAVSDIIPATDVFQVSSLDAALIQTRHFLYLDPIRTNRLKQFFPSLLAGKDQHRCGDSGAYGAGLPEPPRPGRGRLRPPGETEQVPHSFHCELPRRPKDCASGGKLLNSYPPLHSTGAGGHRNHSSSAFFRLSKGLRLI